MDCFQKFSTEKVVTHLKSYLGVIQNIWHGRNACDKKIIQHLLEAQLGRMSLSGFSLFENWDFSNSLRSNSPLPFWIGLELGPCLGLVNWQSPSQVHSPNILRYQGNFSSLPKWERRNAESGLSFWVRRKVLHSWLGSLIIMASTRILNSRAWLRLALFVIIPN